MLFVLGYSLFILAMFYCVLLCKLLGIKILVRSNSSPAGWGHGFLKRFIYGRIMKKADSFLVNSLSFKKQIKNIYGIKAKCIYNPVDSKDILNKFENIIFIFQEI